MHILTARRPDETDQVSLSPERTSTPLKLVEPVSLRLYEPSILPTALASKEPSSASGASDSTTVNEPDLTPDVEHTTSAEFHRKSMFYSVLDIFFFAAYLLQRALEPSSNAWSQVSRQETMVPEGMSRVRWTCVSTSYS
jgi:hypothetical protein